MNPLDYLKVYKNMILGGIFTALVLALFVQTYRINSYKAELAESTAQTAILSDNLNTVNESLNKLSQDSLKRTQDSLEALNKAKAISLSKQDKINRLQKQLNNGDSCEQAIESVKAAL